jgi:hypothetical protein
MRAKYERDFQKHNKCSLYRATIDAKSVYCWMGINVALQDIFVREVNVYVVEKDA